MKKFYSMLIALAAVAGSAYAQEAVDLGLSVKWADRYMGASAVHEVGDYYAWGVTESYTEFSCANYDAATKFAKNQYDHDNRSTCGFWNMVELTADMDVAQVKLPKGWRLPTAAEAEELLTTCTLEDVAGFDGGSKKEGKSVVKFSHNGQSIEIPTDGYKTGTQSLYTARNLMFWTSTVVENADNRMFYPELGYVHYSDMMITEHRLASRAMDIGVCILPVYDESLASISEVEEGEAAEGPAYNLFGQRVEGNAQGIVVRNGEKMMVR